ncbi:MAG: hypothetical protein FWH43_01710 [Endomicrobia bacterium]|nr:hypothetical protein [Endomicrobiia bacterium]
MKMDFLRILKLILYAVSFAEILIFSYLADKSGNNIKMMLITLALLVLNVVIYKLVDKNMKKRNSYNQKYKK